MFSKKNNEIDFACQSCGNCCRYFTINLTHLDIERILKNRPELEPKDFITFVPTEEKDDLEGFISTTGKMNMIMKKKENKKDCIFLNEDNRCGIHGYKPLVCRVWPFSLEKGSVTWIKEHKGFIKKSCRHTFEKGANDPDTLVSQLKQHYKERKILTKMIQKWNEEKKKEFVAGNTFSDILNEHFLSYILKEIDVRKEAEDESLADNEILNSVLETLISTKVIDTILHIPSEDLSSFNRNPDLSLNIYLNDKNIMSFLTKESLEKLAQRMKVKFCAGYEQTGNSGKCSFFIQGKFLTLNIFPLAWLRTPQPFDTRIIYNTSASAINIVAYEEQKVTALENIYRKFWLKNMEALNFIREQNFLDAKLVLNTMVHEELCQLIFWLNKKKFTLLDLPFLDYKTDDLQNFLETFGNYASVYSEQLSYAEKITDIFERNFSLAGLTVEDNFINNFRQNFANLLKN